MGLPQETSLSIGIFLVVSGTVFSNWNISILVDLLSPFGLSSQPIKYDGETSKTFAIFSTTDKGILFIPNSILFIVDNAEYPHFSARSFCVSPAFLRSSFMRCPIFFMFNLL